MNYEEAKSVIENTYIRFGRSSGKTLYLKALQVALQALKKQIPQKTHFSKSAFSHNCAFICPNCKELVGYAQKHCARCGQAIDWSETLYDSRPD